MLTIRKALPDDAPQLSAMGYASYQHHFAHLWRNADELALFLKQEYAEDALHRSLTDANHHWLIAEAASPVGFAKYSYQQRMADDGTTGTLLHKLYMMPGETGHRYGEQIFHAVETRAKTAGERWLWLEVLAANPAARRFYVFVGPFVEIQGNTRIGAESKIQSHTFICEYVTIGRRCFIGHGVMFANDLFRDGKPNADRASWGRIEIGDDVSIGSGATILAVSICDGVVIGAGSVVTRSITEKGVWAGNPARLLRRL